ncbi:MAG: excinuclease ABC subunit UvrC [Ignavibacteriaceae bacterium]|jgi:excinuclease ABC subunit C|nr:excinuclease ABC subunit UvrC [Ignavibacteriaceae bacterium]
MKPDNKTNTIKKKILGVPAKPGCYQFLNDKGKVIYVGKAKNLKNRIASYFNKSDVSPKTTALVSKITDFKVIITDSEMEALILENNLIKELKPRYNINLKDDKSFPYIRITKEPFPRIFSTRKIIRDGSKYIGPFTEAKSLKSALRTVNRLFKIRSCSLNLTTLSISSGKHKICLDYHIKKCDGPCEGYQNELDYNQMVKQAYRVLQGKSEDVLTELTIELNKASDELRFEEAALLRDKILYLNSFNSKQKVEGLSNTLKHQDLDIFGIASEASEGSTTILMVRSGKLIGKRGFDIVLPPGASDDAIIYAILHQYYNSTEELPSEIVLPVEPDDSLLLEKWLSEKATKKITFVYPKIESKLKSLLKMAETNAHFQLKEKQLQKMKKEGNIPYSLEALRRDLSLPDLPKLIECFDISTLQGTDTVASMVVFKDGKPKRSLYRKFIIKSIDYQDDFESMREVIFRRYKRVKEEKLPFPDLIIVDGGKGQLSAAISSLKDLGYSILTSNKSPSENVGASDRLVIIIGLAKKFEEIYDGRRNSRELPIILPKTSSSLKLLQQLRDEAHRFAVTFHRERRSKRIISSELLDIRGIGGKLTSKLLETFGSINKLRNSTLEELQSVVGLHRAKLIYNHFNDKKDD